jgi:hypothetical protein
VEDFDPALAGAGESPMKHHPLKLENLTPSRHAAGGPWQPVSFTGAVSSQRVTEEYEGWLILVGNQVTSIWIYASLTARHTRRAGTKVGPSDPVVECGIAIAQRTKGTLGITG